MAVRVFNYVDFTAGSRIAYDEGTLDTLRAGGILTGPWTVVIAFNRTGSTTESTQFIASASNSGSLRFGVSVTTAGALQVTIGGGASRTFGASFTITNGVWYVFAIRKLVAGTSGLEAKLWNADTGAVVADWTAGSGTVDDDSNLWDRIESGNRVNDFPFNGKIAGWALFSASLDNTAGNTLGTGFDEWLAIGSCVGMWPLTQTDTADPVLDQVGDADQVAITDTTVDLADDPAAFDIVIGGGGADVTLDGIASAASDASGSVSIARPLGTHADAANSASVALSRVRAMSASAPVAGSATGDLSVLGQVSFAGSASVAVSASGALVRGVPLTGLAPVAVDASGALFVRDTTPALEGSAGVTAFAISATEVRRELAASAGATSFASASMLVAAAYVPALIGVEGAASVSANLDQGQAELVDVPSGSTVASGLID